MNYLLTSKLNMFVINILIFLIGPVASSTPEGEQDVVFEAQTTLLKWQENNHPWLELSDVHKGIFMLAKISKLNTA